MVFEIKAIKPAKLRVGRVRLELLNELRAEGRDVKKELEKTTRNWKGAKPAFEILISLAGNDATLLVGPAGNTKGVQKWTWLDEGTRPHVIRARRAPYLRYRLGYNASTRPGTLTSRGSYYVGKHYRRSKVVHHPGTKPRGWVALIQKRRRRKFTKRMLAAVKRGMEKAKVKQ